jgi:hypothetical protein
MDTLALMPERELAQATAFAERLNFGILKGLAQRRAMVGVGAGERPPAAPGRPAHMLAELTERDKNGKLQQVTAIGHRTAVRRMPAVLAKLDHADPVRVAAEIYATAAEKLGSVAGASIDGSPQGGGGGASDGGVTTRIKHATTLREVVGAANAWQRAPVTGNFIMGAELVVLAPGNKHGDRQAITAMGLIRAVCLDGLDMRAILHRAGWSGHSRDVRKLTEAAEELLERIARQILGIDPRRPGQFGHA